MNQKWKKFGVTSLSLMLMIGIVGCGHQASNDNHFGENSIMETSEKYPSATVIDLNSDTASIGGVQIKEYDYTWHCDPTVSHNEVENAPAEYYTGSKADENEDIFVDHELFYFPKLAQEDFKKVRYDGEEEWAYYYQDGENEDFIFATLPNLGLTLPTQMMHSEEEAAENKVLTIRKAGTYVLQGKWKGQVKVRLGEDADSEEKQKVTLVLNGVDIDCSVAPGVIFESVYECDKDWEERETPEINIDTTNAGANVIIADGSENSISGTNVFRMLKTKYKKEDSTDDIKTQKKMRKTDGALYSYMTMNIEGEEQGTGKLTVTSGFEGIDSELHMSVNGGIITINSQDDGINVNEDHVSVIAFNGGDITINAALGQEGDGVDSNGYIVVNGGVVRVNGIRVPDNALDSEDGVHYNGGEILIDDAKQELTSGTVSMEIGGRGFGNRGGGFGGKFISPEMEKDFNLKEFKEKVAQLDDEATMEDVLKLLGIGNRGGEGPLDAFQPPMER